MPETSKTPPARPRAEQPFFFTRIWFEELGLPNHVLAGLKDRGFTLCTPLQSQVIPLALEGKDVVAQASTGSGKVAAYLLPLVARLPERSGVQQENTTSLIIVPTAELAHEVANDIRLFSINTSLSHALALEEESEGGEGPVLCQAPDIIVGTPAAVISHIKRGSFKISGINVLVIDEADRFFDLGTVKDLRYLLRKLPHYEKRRSILFSNTLSYRILAMTYHYMNSPEFVSGVAEESQIQGADQTLFHVDSREKGSLLLGILKREEWKRVLVFANTQASAEGVSRLLRENGVPVESISSDLPQRKRFRLMARLNRGGARVLVTTDADANAVHVEGVSHVVNYDLPMVPLSYIHRAGRITASNGSRRVVSFACEEYVFHLEPIEGALGYKIPVTQPRDDWFAERKDEAAPHPEPVPRAQEHHEEKRPLQLKGGARIAFSSAPGGVFGLAVERMNLPEKGSGGKSRRHRPRRPGKKEQKAGENT